MQTNHVQIQVTQVFTTIYNTTITQKPYLLVNFLALLQRILLNARLVFCLKA